MKLQHLLAASALLALPLAANAAESATAWTCTTKTGMDSRFTTRVCTSPAIASPTTATQGLQLKACDANVKVFWKSSAASSTSTSVFVGPNTSVSGTAGTLGSAAANAVTAAASTTLPATGQCYVWGNITPVAGATETTTFYTIEQSNEYRVSKPW